MDKLAIIKNKYKTFVMITSEQMSGMQSFIVEHLYEKEIDVYCGGDDRFSGRVKAIADNVLTLENKGVYTFVAVDKIIAVWLK